MISKKKAILTHIFKYASAQYFSQFMGFFTAVFMRRFLGPVYMGVWSLLKVVLEYGGYVSLGTISTLCYKLPMLRGRGDEENASRMSKVIFNFVMVTCSIYALSVLIFAIVSRKLYSLEIFTGLIAVSVIILLQRAYTYHVTVARSYKDFSALSVVMAFDAIINFLLTILILSRFKLYGLYGVAIAMPILNMLCIKLLTRRSFVFSVDFKGILVHIKFGISLFTKEILDQVLNSIDSIMIAGMLGLERLGFYSIALMVKSYGGGLVNNFSIVIQPYFMEAMGKDNSSETAQKYIITSSQITAYLMSFIMSLIYIIATPFVYYVLPKFIPGLMAMKIFLVTTFFITISGYYYDYIVVLNKQIRAIPITITAIGISVALNYIFIKRGYGISGVAASTAIAAFTSFMLTSLYALSHLQNRPGILKFLLIIFSPFLYSIVILAVITREITLSNVLVEALVRLIIFVMAFLPLAYYLNRKTGTLRIFFNIVTDKFKKRDNIV